MGSGSGEARAREALRSPLKRPKQKPSPGASLLPIQTPHAWGRTTPQNFTSDPPRGSPFARAHARALMAESKAGVIRLNHAISDPFIQTPHIPCNSLKREGKPQGIDPHRTRDDSGWRMLPLFHIPGRTDTTHDPMNHCRHSAFHSEFHSPFTHGQSRLEFQSRSVVRSPARPLVRP